MDTSDNDLTFARQLVREAGTIFKKYFGHSTATWKADNTPVTEADREINDLIIERIAMAYPQDMVYGEESSTHKQSDRVWAVDPVDGTQLFDNAIPLCTIAITLVEKGVVTLAVVYEPISDTVYYAEKGKGAYKNDQPIHCNAKTETAQSYFATSSKMPEGFATSGQIHDRIEADKGKDYNFRSYTFCAMKVAEGTFSGCVLGVGRLFDIAAPALIVEEAGGKATDLSGDQLDYVNGSKGIIVSNGQLHDSFLEYVSK